MPVVSDRVLTKELSEAKPELKGDVSYKNTQLCNGSGSNLQFQRESEVYSTWRGKRKCGARRSPDVLLSRNIAQFVRGTMRDCRADGDPKPREEAGRRDQFSER